MSGPNRFRMPDLLRATQEETEEVFKQCLENLESDTVFRLLREDESLIGEQFRELEESVR